MANKYYKSKIIIDIHKPLLLDDLEDIEQQIIDLFNECNHLEPDDSTIKLDKKDVK